MIEAKRILPNSVQEASFTLIPKPDKIRKEKEKKKDITRKDQNRKRSILLMNIDAKNLNQNISKLNPTMYKIHNQAGFIPGMRVFQHLTIN